MIALNSYNHETPAAAGVVPKSITIPRSTVRHFRTPEKSPAPIAADSIQIRRQPSPAAHIHVPCNRNGIPLEVLGLLNRLDAIIYGGCSRKCCRLSSSEIPKFNPEKDDVDSVSLLSKIQLESLFPLLKSGCTRHYSCRDWNWFGAESQHPVLRITTTNGFEVDISPRPEDIALPEGDESRQNFAREYVKTLHAYHNAVCMDPAGQSETTRCEIISPAEAKAALDTMEIRHISVDSYERDPLRMLRDLSAFIRDGFSSLNFNNRAILCQIKSKLNLLAECPPGNYATVFYKLFLTGCGTRAWEFLEYENLLFELLPTSSKILGGECRPVLYDASDIVAIKRQLENLDRDFHLAKPSQTITEIGRRTLFVKALLRPLVYHLAQYHQDPAAIIERVKCDYLNARSDRIFSRQRRIFYLQYLNGPAFVHLALQQLSQEAITKQPCLDFVI